MTRPMQPPSRTLSPLEAPRVALPSSTVARRVAETGIQLLSSSNSRSHSLQWALLALHLLSPSFNLPTLRQPTLNSLGAAQ